MENLNSIRRIDNIIRQESVNFLEEIWILEIEL